MNNNDYHYNCEKNLELCMNLECRRDAKFCQFCLANQHYEHQLDYKDVNQLLELIKSSIELQSIFKNELKSQLQILEQIIQDKLSYSSIEIEKLKQIESNLQRGQYLDLRESIKSLKEYNQGKYQKENGEFLTKLKNITQAIKIVTTNTNSQYKNSIEERQHQIPNIQIQTGLIQTNSQLQVQNSQTFQCRLTWESNNHSTQEQQYLNKSIQLINCNSYEDAINFCNDAIKINSQSYQAHVNKGFALSRMQFYDQALNYYEKAIEINSNYFCAYLLKSSNIFIFRYHSIETKRYPLALNYCDFAIKLYSVNRHTYNYKAYTLINLNKYYDAIENCKQSLRITKNNLDAYLLITFALNKQEDYKNAISYCVEAQQNQIQNDIIYNNQAIHQLKTSQNQEFGQALSCFNKAIDINSDSDEAIANKGMGLYCLKMYKSAVQCFDQAYKISNDDKYRINRLQLELYHITKYGTTLSNMTDDDNIHRANENSKKCIQIQKIDYQIEEILEKNVYTIINKGLNLSTKEKVLIKIIDFIENEEIQKYQLIAKNQKMLQIS